MRHEINEMIIIVLRVPSHGSKLYFDNSNIFSFFCDKGLSYMTIAIR